MDPKKDIKAMFLKTMYNTILNKINMDPKYWMKEVCLGDWKEKEIWFRKRGYKK